jgi:hypothetical protein
VSLGLAQWSEAAEADLLRLLDGRPAVLLVPSHDRTWSTMDAATVARHALVWLSRPYGAEDMRVALEKAAAAARRTLSASAAVAAAAMPARAPAPARPPVVAPSVPPAAPVAPLAAMPPTRVTRPVVSVAAPAAMRSAAAAEDIPGLTVAELQARLATLPEPGRHVFLRKLSEMLGNARPFEARFTVQNSVIFHPADGWVASNTPMMVIERVCQSDAMASAVAMREIEGSQAEERAQRLNMPLRELNTFLWALAAASLDKKPLRPGA